MKENTNTARVGTADGTAGAVLQSGGASSALFVINLSTSMAPIPVPGKALPGLERYRLYQVMRTEDGRTRYRLRLGFFAVKSEADTILERVRSNYPTAFATCLSKEDEKFARSYVPAASANAAARRSPAAASSQARPAAASQAAAAPQAKASPAARGGAPTSKSTGAKPPAQAPTAPPQSQKAVADESAVIEISWEPPQQQAKPAKSTAKSPAPTAAPPKPAPAKPARAQSPAKAPAAARPQAKPAAPAASQPAKPAARGKPPAESPVYELTLEPEAAASAKPAAPSAPATPFHVGKGADIPAVSLDLQADAAPQNARQNVGQGAAPKRPSEPFHVGRNADTGSFRNTETMRLQGDAATSPARPAAKSPATPARPAPAAPAAGARNGEAHVPELDSTQTIRALTKAELEDDSQEKWFAIQLAVSEQPVNLETMPRLDIFEAYRLYSVANAASGKIMHYLRLGFFREKVSAEAVSGYLRTFFPDPTTVRVSTAEQTRFKDPPSQGRPKGPVDPRAQAKVIELSEARERSKPAIPTVTLEVAPGAKGKIDPGATGSFKPNATGSFKLAQSGAHKVLTPTLKPAPKSATPPTKRTARSSKNSATGKYRAPPRMSLTEALLEEARQVELSESGIHRLPKNNSLLSRLVGKLTK